MIPKRAVGALITTVFALAMLLSFKTPEAPALTGSTSGGSAIVGQPSPTTGTTTPGAVAATPTPGATTAPTTGGTGTTTAGAYVDGTVTGPVESNRYGNVQVQVTISGGVLTDVTALQLPSGDRRTNNISASAEPALRSEALTAQSANINLLSGATYTSESYVQSLQAALDQASA
jgi:uncharacterized protein with FMN-binding domain